MGSFKICPLKLIWVSINWKVQFDHFYGKQHPWNLSITIFQGQFLPYAQRNIWWTRTHLLIFQTINCCWTPFQSLVVLGLANNNFSGKIPTSMGSMYNIQAFQLRNNKFSVELPATLKECTNLEVLGMGGNEFSGLVPEWRGDSFPHLRVLGLLSKNLSGTIPSQLCHLQHTPNLWSVWEHFWWYS